jgi:hypothetical protein
MKWRPAGRRKRERPEFTWEEGIRGLMGEKGLVEEDWNDRHNWRKKIIKGDSLARGPKLLKKHIQVRLDMKGDQFQHRL